MATITNTDLTIRSHFGEEKFSGVVGVQPNVAYCTDPLLLTYINGLLTGQYILHDGMLRSISDGSKSVVKSTTTKQGEVLAIKQDTGTITMDEAQYKVSYFAGHSVYYALAQYTNSCGGCADLCNFLWDVINTDTTISQIYAKQKRPMSINESISAAMRLKFPKLVVTVGADVEEDESTDVIQGCDTETVELTSDTQIDQLDLSEVEFS